MQFIDVKLSETLKIGDVILTVVQKSGQRVRFEVSAPKHIEVKRLTLADRPVK